MSKYVWERACIQKDEEIVQLGGGNVSFADDEVLKFLREAGENGKAFSRSGIVILYYNSATGDVLIQNTYMNGAIEGFLNFISRDDHEDVQCKEVMV